MVRGPGTSKEYCFRPTEVSGPFIKVAPHRTKNVYISDS